MKIVSCGERKRGRKRDGKRGKGREGEERGREGEEEKGREGDEERGRQGVFGTKQWGHDERGGNEVARRGEDWKSMGKRGEERRVAREDDRRQ